MMDKMSMMGMTKMKTKTKMRTTMLVLLMTIKMRITISLYLLIYLSINGHVVDDDKIDCKSHLYRLPRCVIYRYGSVRLSPPPFWAYTARGTEAGKSSKVGPHGGEKFKPWECPKGASTRWSRGGGPVEPWCRPWCRLGLQVLPKRQHKCVTVILSVKILPEPVCRCSQKGSKSV